MSTRVRVEGMKELEAQLERLRTATGQAALRRAGLKAMEPMAQLAQQNAPVETGELVGSIVVGAKATDAEVGKIQYASVKKAGGSDAEALAALRDARRDARGTRGKWFVDVFMGPRAGRPRDEVIKGFAQEFGTVHMEPHPYMRPAFDQDKGPMLERLKGLLWAEVEKAVARAQKRGSLRG